MIGTGKKIGEMTASAMSEIDEMIAETIVIAIEIANEGVNVSGIVEMIAETTGTAVVPQLLVTRACLCQAWGTLHTLWAVRQCSALPMEVAELQQVEAPLGVVAVLKLLVARAPGKTSGKIRTRAVVVTTACLRDRSGIHEVPGIWISRWSVVAVAVVDV
jgi:hypothetical protein